MSRSHLIALIILIVHFAACVLSYAHLPETIPTHFDMWGTPDGFSSKSKIYLLPLFSGIIFVFLWILDKMLYAGHPHRKPDAELLAFVQVFTQALFLYILISTLVFVFCESLMLSRLLLPLVAIFVVLIMRKSLQIKK